ncbi:MAG TPA: ribonuclease E/G, partial [Candidatus Limnocylindrales bacterium]|nr:ribonuclease E/G [Candidatus Limnocylindrales bacterium]
MSKELVISATPHETRVAILEDGHLCEIYIEREKEFALVGSIYKGRVTRVLPGMQSAFVDIGRDTDAFLYVSDFLEHLEEYDHVPAEEERAPQPVPITSPGTPIERLPAQSVGALPGEAPASPQYGGAEPLAEQGHQQSEAETPTFSPGEGEPSLSETGFDSQPRVENPSGSFSQEREASPAEDLNAPPAEPVPSFNRPAPANQGYVRNDRPRNDRGDRGGYGQGRGGDRGRGGRGGRFRRGSGGRGDRPRGRDLPASKYASPNSPRSSYTPRDNPGEFTPPSEALEPILLPGESLAKYRDRVPAPPVGPTPAQGSTSDVNTQFESAAGTAESTAPVAQREESTSSLPSSLYTPAESSAETESGTRVESLRDDLAHESRPAGHVHWPSHEPMEETGAEAAAAGPTESAISHSVPPPVPSAHEEWIEFEPAQTSEALEEEHGDSARTLQPPADLSEDQARTLAESLAEAKHEEAQEEIEDGEAHPIGGADFADAEADAAHAEADEIVAEENDAHGTSDEIRASSEPSGSENLEMQPQDSSASQPSIPQNNYRNDREPRSARMDDRRSARFQRPARRGGPRGGRPVRHGRPPERHGHGHAPQRRPQLISEMLKANQEIIVQIAKEPLGKKGARITSHVALPGRFLVYMPTVNHIGVSRKINSAETRSRLRSIVGEYKSTFPGGFIVRTAAGNVTEQDLRADIEYLGKMWHEICARSEQKKAPALLHRDLNLVERILRDYVNSDYSSIWIDNEEEFSKVIEFVSRFQPELASRVKLYTKETPIFEEFGIQQELDKAMRPKVWLKSGGYIVINHTEALVAIDVNTGKFVGRGSTRLEDTIVKTNVEAVKEIVR